MKGCLHLIGFFIISFLTLVRIFCIILVRTQYAEYTIYLLCIDSIVVAVCLIMLMIVTDRAQFARFWWFSPWLGYLWASTIRLITTVWLDDFIGMWVRTSVGIFGVYLLGGLAFWLRKRGCRLPQWHVTDLGGCVFAIGGRASLI